MKHLLYPLALGLIALIGCGKDKPKTGPAFDTTGTYTVSTTPEAGPVRMFTAAGEVQNAALIRKYSERYAGLFFSPGPTSPFQTAELVFDGNSSALTSSAWMMGILTTSTTPVEITTQTPDQLVLTSKNPRGSLLAPQNPDKCANVLRDIRGVSPVYTCNALPPSSGFSSQCEYRPVYVFNLRDAQARMVTLSFIFSAAANGQACSIGYRNDLNRFNTAFRSRLATGDTVVVQETEYLLTKK